LTVTPNGGYGHFFPTDRFATPVYFEEDGGAGAGGPSASDVITAAGAEADAGTGGNGPGGEPITPAPEGGSGEPVVTPESTPDPADDTIPEALRPYVKQLRDEAAERRVALKPYEDVFGKFDAEESQALLKVIDGLTDESTQYEAATMLKQVVESILGDGSEDPDRPLTRADLERIEQQKQQQAQQEAAVQAVIKEATDLGYPEGTREHRRLLDVAVNETKGDLKAAHEAIQKEKDAIIAEYAKQVMEGKAKWPTLAPATGTTPADVSGEAPKTWAEARANAQARARAAAG
jgi:hypothetical protein